MKCLCGLEVNNKKEWYLHYMIGAPSIPIKSRLTKTTDKQVIDAKLRLKEYKRKHILIK